MRKLLLHVLIITLAAISNNVIAQKMSHQISESYVIDTDRDIYFIADEVWFKLINFENGTPQKVSSIVYVELLSNKGISLVQQSYQNKNGEINGKMLIPDTLVSGIYYLRAYSEWMKNWGPQCYATKSIQIIHPSKIPINEKSSLKNKLEYFAEGQKIIAGIPNKIVVKSSSPKSTVITNAKKDTLALVKEFSSNYGFFKFTPQPDSTYFLSCKNEQVVINIDSTGIKPGIDENGNIYFAGTPKPKMAYSLSIHKNDQIWRKEIKDFSTLIPIDENSVLNGFYYIELHCNDSLIGHIHHYFSKPKTVEPCINVADKQITTNQEVTLTIDHLPEDFHTGWCSVSAQSLHFNKKQHPWWQQLLMQPQLITNELNSSKYLSANDIETLNKLLLTAPPKVRTKSSGHFTPEINFMQINGSIQLLDEDQSQSQSDLLLYLEGDNPYFEQTRYDSLQNFKFFLPIKDIRKKVVMVQAIHQKKIEKVQLNSPFDNRSAPFEMPAFQFDSSKITAYDQAFVRWQLELVYKGMHAQKTAFEHPEQYLSFYETIPSRVYPEAYDIKVNSPLELFHEIGRRAKVKGKKGEHQLFILHHQTNNDMGNNPLLLINGCPVINSQEILNIPVKNIHYFETVDVPFCIGNRVYDGIIQVVTKNFERDLAAPDNAYRLVYPFLNAEVKMNPVSTNANASIPYIANTLLYRDFQKKNAQLTFNTGNNTGTFLIQVKGYRQSGEPFWIRKEIEILPKEDVTQTF